MSWDTQIFDSQQRLADLLNADDYINDTNPALKIPVVTRRVGDIARAVQEAIGKVGIVIIVMLPGSEFTGEAARIALRPKFAIMVKENPVLNQSATGTRKAAEVVIAHVIKAVHWQPNNPALGIARQNLFQIEKNAVQLLRPTPGDAPLTYAISVAIQINL